MRTNENERERTRTNENEREGINAEACMRGLVRSSSVTTKLRRRHMHRQAMMCIECMEEEDEDCDEACVTRRACDALPWPSLDRILIGGS